jgi:hypothetical protein
MPQIVAFATLVADIARDEKICQKISGKNLREAARSADIVQYEKNR